MKNAVILTLAKEKLSVLEKLRHLGVMHIKSSFRKESTDASKLENDLKEVEKLLFLFASAKAKGCFTEEMSGEEFREMYGLASSCFEFQQFENDARIITKGVGHGLGLSQYTANEMAKNGKTCEEILQFFFPGTEIKEVAEILWKVE